MSTIINATTTNGVVIQPDNSGSLVLQTNSGTTALTIDTSQNITTTNKLASASMPIGSVLQVVQGTLGTTASSSSSTMADTGITASITPKSSSNKILVIVQLNACGKQTGNTYMRAKLVRGATDIQVMESLAGYDNSSGFNWIGSISSTYLDAPATTSSTTYKIQFASAENVAAVYINGNSGGFLPVSTITLLEIAA
jgi:hypothetical protein